MQIQISWLLQKPTDLDLYCLQSKGISRLSRTRVKKLKNKFCRVYSSFAYTITIVSKQVSEFTDQRTCKREVFVCKSGTIFLFYFSIKFMYCEFSLERKTHYICFYQALVKNLMKVIKYFSLSSPLSDHVPFVFSAETTGKKARKNSYTPSLATGI